MNHSRRTLPPMIILCFAAALAQAETLLWSEEFNYTGAPDSKVWNYDYGDWGWGNQELQDYTDNPANVRVDGSNLVITAIRDGDYFSSARIKTLDKLTFKYATVEAMIQTPDLADGLWPAFWTLGNKFPASGWPDCGEIDIMEMGNAYAISVNKVNRRVGSTAHWENNNSHASYGLYYDKPSNINGTFVKYRMEWTSSSIKTYIDGAKIWEIDITNPTSRDLEEFHEPHFFLLNLAVGGTYPARFDAGGITAPFPAEYKVDWIRIYDNGETVLGGTSLEEDPVPGTNFLDNAGFESAGLNPWVGYSPGGANNDGGYVESTSSTYYNGGNPGGDNVLTRSGDYVSKIFGDFTGGANYNGYYQDIDAGPGSIWKASGWALTHPQDLMVGANTAWIEVSFRDNANNILSLYRSPVLTSSSVTPGEWMNLEVTEEINPSTGAVIRSLDTLTAPSGTSKVRYQTVFSQTGYDGGSMYFDDLSLVKQILPFELDSSMAGGTMQISFPTQNGVSYEVVYTTNLTDEVWTYMETIIGDGATNSVSYPASDPVRFYKVSTP